jgi:hypothetical protein
MATSSLGPDHRLLSIPTSTSSWARYTRLLIRAKMAVRAPATMRARLGRPVEGDDPGAPSTSGSRTLQETRGYVKRVLRSFNT